jgi:hypothetical protein
VNTLIGANHEIGNRRRNAWRNLIPGSALWPFLQPERLP